jgi:protein-disulfide isomerase
MSKQATLERRRAARLAAQQAGAARERRIRRLWRLGAAAAAAVVLVVAGIAVSSSGGKPATVTPSSGSSSTLFAGIPEHGGVLGDPKAPLTVTEYLDLQCPICREASTTTVPALVKQYVRSGKVKLQARPLQFIGPGSVRAAKVAAGAERQGRLWPFLEAFYARQGQENSGYVTDSFLRDVASASGVDGNAALAQADSAFASGRLNRANADAARLGIQATPTLTVRRGNGPEQVLDANALDPASVASALNKELAR